MGDTEISQQRFRRKYEQERNFFSPYPGDLATCASIKETFSLSERPRMSSQHHYVSKFHLREFCDPDSLSTRDPWVWLGQIETLEVKRRSPKNFGTVPLLFDGPGGLADRNSTIESFLAKEVEGPAAAAIKKIAFNGATELPSELMRYLAWAASRCLPMQRMDLDWSVRFEPLHRTPLVEPAPAFLERSFALNRDVALLNPATGELRTANGQLPNSLIDEGWIPDPSYRINFLEMAHVQALYFQERWFPRLRWFTLRPPDGDFFIIGDRAVGWGVPDCLDAPPCCLRDPGAFLIAPVTRSLVLVGRNHSAACSVTPTQINSIIAGWSHQWIAGPTETIVQKALESLFK